MVKEREMEFSLVKGKELLLVQERDSSHWSKKERDSFHWSMKERDCFIGQRERVVIGQRERDSSHWTKREI